MQVGPDGAIDAAPLVPRVAVVPEAGDDAAERLRTRVEPRPAGVVLEAGQRRSPATSSHSSRTSPIMRCAPATVS